MGSQHSTTFGPWAGWLSPTSLSCTAQQWSTVLVLTWAWALRLSLDSSRELSLVFERLSWLALVAERVLHHRLNDWAEFADPLAWDGS